MLQVKYHDVHTDCLPLRYKLLNKDEKHALKTQQLSQTVSLETTINLDSRQFVLAHSAGCYTP